MHKDKCQWVLEFSQLLCNNIGNDHIMRKNYVYVSN